MKNRYAIRAVKYCAWLMIVFMVVFTIMNLTGTSEVRGIEGIKEMFSSGSQGYMLVAVIVALSAIYPSVGFSKREIAGTLVNGSSTVVDVMKRYGFSFEGEENGVMVFHATSIVKKFLMYFEDRIEVSYDGSKITINGMRKELVKIEYRLSTLLLPNND